MSRVDELLGLCYCNKYLRISDYKAEMSVWAHSLLVHSFGPVVKQEQYGGNIWRGLLTSWWPGNRGRGQAAKRPEGSGDKRHLKVCFSGLLPPTRPHIVLTHSAINSFVNTIDEVSVLRIHSAPN